MGFLRLLALKLHDTQILLDYTLMLTPDENNSEENLSEENNLQLYERDTKLTHYSIPHINHTIDHTLRSICGEQWMVQIRRTPASKSTFAGM